MITNDFLTTVLNPNLTRDEAINIANYITTHYDQFTDLELAYIQINQPLLIMDFGKFHEAVEHVTSRSIFDREFGIESCVEQLKNKINDLWNQSIYAGDPHE